ncbi:interleukin-15-like isoform X2 [Micropterus salmoides]|uniref:interleukin-15-like isoform X2 n=1 Tax=Micropterus salmoides TaxID=27706 RepID=UPI0018EAD72D|nr:interleukin-15-like isoform X2 [Micropterus salmoides]
MTDFMKVIPVILVQPTCYGEKRAKDVQFQSTCNLCRESHKTQVWLCFLVLSLLSTSMYAASVPGTDIVQTCLEKLKHTIEKSDAMLYAPSRNDYHGNCKNMTLKCYMLELIMVLNEEEIVDNKVDCILDFNAKLLEDQSDQHNTGCLPCEAHSLKNITIFLERLKTLLEEITTEGNS